jgi:dTDP-4-amino-4,6-dideoxygalactose transaminase
MNKLPLLDLKAQYASLKSEIDAVIAANLEQTAFVMGPAVRELETAFAAYLGCDHVVGCANGTDALTLVLRALRIGPGDEVITVPNTFIATAEAISMTGATPVFVDVDPANGLIQPALVNAAISSRTRAIIPVHLYGQVADVDALIALASPRGLAIIEDSAQAHGARLRGRRVGSIGVAGTFSFYPGKNLGAYGDAGAMSFRDATLARTCAMLRDHGRSDKYLHEVPGFNSRLDTLQAAVLVVKLRHLDRWNAARRRIAGWYQQRLEGIADLTLLQPPKDTESVWHQFVIFHPRRDRLRSQLAEEGIATGIHYPVPLHLQPAYASLGLHAGAFPIAERQAETCLSLPMYPELEEADVDRIAHAIRRSL